MRFLKRKYRRIPIYIFGYHKGGTTLFRKIFREFCDLNNKKFLALPGKQTHIPQNADVILFPHSLIDLSLISEPFLGVHTIRDPRDIVVSGYLYHRRTNEKWCVNSDFDFKHPIMFPQVPYSQEYRSEDWKMKYLKSLNGMSYQNNLLNMSQYDGLFFEMNNYGTWTIESMDKWDYNNENILEIRFEDVMNNFGEIFKMIFEHLRFSKSEIKQGINIAAKHDLNRKSKAEIARIKHVSSPKASKWKDYFETRHIETFGQKFGDIMLKLGYE
ncbi:MAG: sulfotransferase domain-containing protein [Melioribacteraceae bacterium]|nr:sulfotransferase domain-containing protein [Melioribacteraceae bacterium]